MSNKLINEKEIETMTYALVEYGKVTNELVKTIVGLEMKKEFDMTNPAMNDRYMELSSKILNRVYKNYPVNFPVKSKRENPEFVKDEDFDKWLNRLIKKSLDDNPVYMTMIATEKQLRRAYQIRIMHNSKEDPESVNTCDVCKYIQKLKGLPDEDRLRYCPKCTACNTKLKDKPSKNPSKNC